MRVIACPRTGSFAGTERATSAVTARARAGRGSAPVEDGRGPLRLCGCLRGLDPTCQRLWLAQP